MSESSIDEAAVIIRKGGVVAFPTETYYGLAVDPYNESALQRLCSLKQRQSGKAILVLIEDFNGIESVVAAVPDEFMPLIEKYWPGPLTLVFPAKKSLSPFLTAHSGTVGVRVSSHPVAQALVRKMGKPITATSANLSGNMPAESAREVKKIFGTGIDYIIDGGETTGGSCSTLVALRDKRLTVLRDGKIDLAEDLYFCNLE